MRDRNRKSPAEAWLFQASLVQILLGENYNLYHPSWIVAEAGKLLVCDWVGFFVERRHLTGNLIEKPGMKLHLQHGVLDQGLIDWIQDELSILLENAPSLSFLGGESASNHLITAKVRVNREIEGVLTFVRLDQEFIDRDFSDALEYALIVGRALTTLLYEKMANESKGQLLPVIPLFSYLAPQKYDASYLFLDMRGFSKMMKRRILDESSRIIGVFLKSVASPVFSHGYAAEMLGDALVAYFWEGMHALNAVIAGLEIEKVLQTSQKVLGENLQVRIGVACGIQTSGSDNRAVLGMVGMPPFEDFKALGDRVNLAARLEQGYPDDGRGVYVDADTLNLVLKQAKVFGFRVEFTDHGRVKFKGVGEHRTYLVTKVVNGG